MQDADCDKLCRTPMQRVGLQQTHGVSTTSAALLTVTVTAGDSCWHRVNDCSVVRRTTLQTSVSSLTCIHSVSQKIPPELIRHFSKTVVNFNPFLHTYYAFLYARLQIFIQLSPTLTKLCHIKRDYIVHIICSICPPSTERHAFRRLRKSLIASLIVVCGKWQVTIKQTLL